MSARRRPQGRTAILSFQSHGDRSFLDDRGLALVSGELRAQGLANDLVLTVLDGDAGRGETEAEQRLVECLRDYDLVLYERVWSRELVAWLRAALPEVSFVSCRGEHALDNPPADFTLNGPLQACVPAFVAWIRGHAPLPPAGTRVWEGRRFVEPSDVGPVPDSRDTYEPNLRPRLVNPDALPKSRTFSVVGNKGCPFQSDARENPLYRGVEIPLQYGRGCAFCTTGNEYLARPNAETAAHVLGQIRFIRKNAPELELLVLKDQNPFGYLTELVTSCAEEGLGDFSLLLETRADWFLRNDRRFERALETAGGVGIKLSPFLIGIENFSQPELDRFNKGTTVAANVEFLEALWRWKATYGDALELRHAAFGFVLFTPWTTLADLRANCDAVGRTRFHQFRGSILHSRARLYPETALFYLARQDGLLTDVFEGSEDNSKRYGYYPARPWRFLHPETAHFAALAVELTERTGSRDQMRLFECLLTAFESAPSFESIDAESVLRAYGSSTAPTSSWEAAPEPLRRRFETLVRPLGFSRPFAGGWRLGALRRDSSTLEVELSHDRQEPLKVWIAPRGGGPWYRQSKHFDLTVQGRDLTPSQQEALDLFCRAILQNDG